MDQKDNRYAPWEKAFDRILTPFEEFVHDETAGGVVLILATVTALILANSPFHDAYHHALEMPIAISIGGWRLEHSLHHWINDGLMALFFFVVGLEIKREVLVGELSDPKQAALPIIAAIGGMVIPALVYVALNPGGPSLDGWGIPMATDIAFAVGIMAMLGNRVPPGVLTFLVALAIVDDLGAVLVIAVFYTEQIIWYELITALVLFGLLLVFNRLGIRNALPYFGVGTLMWMAMLESGVHSTLAGVLTALAIPAIPRYEPRKFSLHVRELIDRFDRSCSKTHNLMTNDAQLSVVHTLERGIHNVQTPLKRLEHNLHLPVAFVIVPLFALANAGIPIHFGELGQVFAEPTTLGVFAGLLIGKMVGVAGISLLAVKLGIGRLPAGSNPKHILGVGMLAAIGFTMSIFIAELAFRGQPEQIVMAKTGVLFASLIAGSAGYIWLRFFAGDRPAEPRVT